MIIDRLTIAPISSPLKARRSFHRGRSTLVHIYARKLNEYESRYERTCESWVQHHQRQVWSLLVRSYNKDAFCRYLRILSSSLSSNPCLFSSRIVFQHLPLCLSLFVYLAPSSSPTLHLSLFLFLFSFLFLPLSLGIFLFSPLFLPLPLFYPLSGRTFCFEDSPFERSSRVHPSPSYMYPASLRHVRPSSRFLPPM